MSSSLKSSFQFCGKLVRGKIISLILSVGGTTLRLLLTHLRRQVYKAWNIWKLLIARSSSRNHGEQVISQFNKCVFQNLWVSWSVRMSVHKDTDLLSQHGRDYSRTLDPGFSSLSTLVCALYQRQKNLYACSSSSCLLLVVTLIARLY